MVGPMQNQDSLERSDIQHGDGACHVVVRSTFLDVDEGQGLMTCFRRMRKAKTDFIMLGPEQEVYEPGRYSEDTQVTPDATQHVTLEPSSPCSAEQDLPELQSDQTTVMLRNLPNNYTREMLLTLLNDKGFAGRFDFVYLPMDFCRDANLGYAFVNLCDTFALRQLWRRFDGFCDWQLPSSKVCEVKLSGPHQGFKDHVERYRNSPVMHRSVPDEYKPVIFKDGVRIAFPRPTKRIKPPHGAFW